MSGISIKSVCCTCLSADRKLYQLCRILDGINLLYILLTHDPDAFKEGFYRDAANLLVCWECGAIIKRIRRFRTQACIAQKQLASFADEKNLVNLETLSQLNIVHNKNLYEFKCNFINMTENFIDCGTEVKDIYVKSESDSDDIPLSILRYENDYEINSDVLHQPDINEKIPDNGINHLENNKFQNSIKACDNSVINSKNNTKLLSNSTLNNETRTKSVNVNPISKKYIKMKYSKYFSIVTMSQEEMLQSLQQRKADLDKDAVFKCDMCLIKFKRKNELLLHNEELHSQTDGYSQCDICHSHAQDLPTHTLSHYQAYRCVLCTHTSHTHTDVVKHLKGEHSDVCCGVKKISKMKRESEILVEKKYPCSECDMSFLNKDHRWKHVQRAHREGYKCGSCEKRFAFKSNLERHERIHRGPLPREQCPVCHKLVRTDLLNTHTRTHTHRQGHTCVQCDKHFLTRHTYESHLKYARAHATVDVCRFQCESCDKRYRSRGELTDHVNYRHRGHAAHKCPLCGKGLATKRCIRRHVRRAHEGIKECAKDKICQQCGKAFRDNKGVIEHERVHTGARPLACRACGRAFRQRAALHAHTTRMHPNNITTIHTHS